MTNRADLEALAVRCEQATRADRELSWDIWHAVDEPGIDQASRDGSAPPYTASLDAALTLVPEGCAVDFRRYTDGRARAVVWRTVTHPEPPFEHHCERAASSALALTAACLKARAHAATKGETDDR